MKRIKLSLLFCFSFAVAIAQPPPCPNLSAPNPGSGIGITDVMLDVLNHNTSIEEGYTQEYLSAGVPVPDLTRCVSHTITVVVESMLADPDDADIYGRSNRVWIDWNEDADFLDQNEEYFPDVQNLDEEDGEVTYIITVPLDAPLGNKIMRVYSGFGLSIDPCLPFDLGGDVEDYRINVVEDNMSVDSVIVDRLNTCIQPSDTCMPILRMAIYTTGTQDPVVATDFNFTTNGTTDNSDIESARIFYTGNSPFFSCDTSFGNNIVNPTGAFNALDNRFLNTGTACQNIHYFWLAYNVSSSASVGNLINGEFINVTLTEQGISSDVASTTTYLFDDIVVRGNIEICDNGIDDDCDGLVDCFDPDCSGLGICNSNIEEFFYGLPADNCSESFQANNTDFALRKEWTFPSISPRSRFVAIADLDGDQISEIVLNSSDTSLIVLDGSTGNIKRNFIQPSYINGIGVLADADGNGSGEIYWTTGNQQGIVAYDYATSTTIWGPINYSGTRSMSVVDFNGDGVAELFTHNNIINTVDGSLMGTINDVPIVSDQSERIAVDLLPDYYCASCAGEELLIGTAIYSVAIDAGIATLKEISTFQRDPFLINFPAVGLRQSSVADFNNDGLLDVITATENMIFKWNPRTGEIMDSAFFSDIPIPFKENGIDGNFGPTPLSIDDVDNDGDLDVVFCMAAGNTDAERVTVALDNNFNLLWMQEGIADNNRALIPTIFDLNGDGNKEVIVRPETSTISGRPYLFILDAATGLVMDSSIYCETLTLSMEIGVMVADVDNDGEAEIITGGAPVHGANLFSDPLELMVIGSCETKLVCARNMWHQRRYVPISINDDLTVPLQQQNHGTLTTLNHWGNQVSYRDTAGNLVCPKPDATITIDTVMITSCDSLSVSITVCNVGKVPIHESGCSVAKYVSFYNDDPLTAGTLIKTDTLPTSFNLIGSCFTLYTDVYVSHQPFDLYAVVNDNGIDPLTAPNTTFSECHLSNNIATISVYNSVTFFDTLILCEGDSVFLESAFQTVSGLYVDSTTTSNGCDSISYTTLVVEPLPDATITTQDPVCIDDGPVQLIAADMGGIWRGTGIVDEETGIFDPAIADIGINVIEYLVGTDCKDSSEAELFVSSGGEITALLINDSCSSLIGMIDLTIEGNSPFIIRWSNDSLLEDITGLNSGEYTVIVMDSLGCEVQRTYIIEDDGVGCNTIYLPNSFTPNGDGINDLFYPELLGVLSQDYNFEIYDRWGEQIFKTNNLGRGWDGNYKGKLVQEGVYIWRLTYWQQEKGETNQIIGRVTLIR